MTDSQKNKLGSLGVDLDETLERFVGNEDLFFRCLNKFIDDKNYTNMISAMEANDASASFDSAHALKGVSANLGLSNLYNEMKVITEVFRAGSMNYDSENFNRIKAFYDEAISTIKALWIIVFY